MEKLVTFNEIGEFLIAEVMIDKLDLFETPNVLAVVENTLHGKNPKAFIVDLNNVGSIDSSGIGFLIAARNSLMKKNIPFVVSGAGDAVMQVFRLTKIIQLIKVYSTLEEAIGDLKK